jgi:hypothetical protein
MKHTSTNVISLDGLRELRKAEEQNPEYQAQIDNLDKLDLLEEMVRFQEERNRVGRLTLGMMVRGKILFRALETCAETDELRLLTGSYRRHLDFELQAYLKKKTSAARA